MRTSRGFTVIELLTVVAIIALLASIIVANYTSSRDKARIAAGMQFDAHIFHVLGSEIFAAWQMNEGAGGIVADSANGNTITMQNAGYTWNTTSYHSSSKNSLYNNGVFPYAKTSKIITPSGSFTITAWVRPTTPTGISTNPIVHRYVGGTATPELFFGIEPFNGPLSGRLKDNAGNQIYASWSQNGKMYDNKWHHVALFFDATVKKLTVFVDAKEVASATNASFDPANWTSPIQYLLVATDTNTPYGGGGFTWKGDIDDLRIYDGAPK